MRDSYQNFERVNSFFQPIFVFFQKEIFFSLGLVSTLQSPLLPTTIHGSFIYATPPFFHNSLHRQVATSFVTLISTIKNTPFSTPLSSSPSIKFQQPLQPLPTTIPSFQLKHKQQQF